VLRPASDTIASPRWPNAKPNGTGPLDGVATDGTLEQVTSVLAAAGLTGAAAG